MASFAGGSPPRPLVHRGPGTPGATIDADRDDSRVVLSFVGWRRGPGAVNRTRYGGRQRADGRYAAGGALPGCPTLQEKRSVPEVHARPLPGRPYSCPLDVSKNLSSLGGRLSQSVGVRSTRRSLLRQRTQQDRSVADCSRRVSIGHLQNGTSQRFGCKNSQRNSAKQSVPEHGLKPGADATALICRRRTAEGRAGSSLPVDLASPLARMRGWRKGPLEGARGCKKNRQRIGITRDA